MEEDAEKLLIQSAGLTQKLLGEHISKPVLAEKYLMKPPFRFLHEIFTSVIETTGFMKNEFPQNHLKYDKINNVDDQRAFLKTAIDAIESETNEKCEARPSKILSGKEPEKTNDMLQLLAKAISSFKSKDNSKPSKGLINKSKVTHQKPIERKAATELKPEEVKRARSRPPVKNLASQKSTNSQESVARDKAHEKSRPEVSTQSKNKIDSKKGKSSGGGGGNEEEVKSVTPIISTKKSEELLKSKVISSVASPTNQSSASKSTSKINTLVKKSSSTKLLSVDPRKSLKLVEKVSSQDKVTAGTSEAKSKDVKSSESVSTAETCNQGMSHGAGNPIESKNDSNSTMKPNTGMPPETMEEIPTQRPVTRKKRFKTTMKMTLV